MPKDWFHLNFREMLTIALRAHRFWNDGTSRLDVEIKVSADKFVATKEIGVNLYGFSLCDKRFDIDHQSPEAQFVVGAYMTNAEPLSKKGDTLVDYRTYAQPFHDALAEVEQNGIVVDGRRVFLKVVKGGDFAWLKEALGFGSESLRGKNKYVDAETPAFRSDWGRLDKNGDPVVWPRVEHDKINEYREKLQKASEGVPAILPHEMHPSLPSLGKKKAAELNKMLFEYATAYGEDTAGSDLGKVKRKDCIERLNAIQNKYNVNSGDIYRWMLDANVFEETLTRDRAKEIVRPLVSHEEFERISLLFDTCEELIFVAEMHKILERRLELIMWWRCVDFIEHKNELAIYDSIFCLCVGHMICRIKCCILKHIFSDFVRTQKHVERINLVCSKILGGEKARDGVFSLVVNREKGGSVEHHKQQPLTWQEADKLFASGHLITTEAYEKEAEKKAKVDDLLVCLGTYCDLIKKKTDFVESDFVEEKRLRMMFGRLGDELWGGKEFVNGIYLHKVLSGVVAWHMRHWGNLYRYSNQGVEAIIRKAKSYMRRCTSMGGCKWALNEDGSKRKERQGIIEPLMEWVRRKCFYLSPDFDELVKKESLLCDIKGEPRFDTARDFIAQMDTCRKYIATIDGDVHCKNMTMGPNEKRYKTIYKTEKH